MANPRVDRLEQQFANIQTMFEGLMKQTAENTKILAANSKGMEEINNLLSKDGKSSRETSSSKTRDKQSYGSTNSTTQKYTKLDFPMYNGGEDPTSWMCRVEQFFEFKKTEEEEKLPMAAYHLEGEAQMWYQLFRESGEVLTWDSLKMALHTRYGPTVFEDHFGELTKLQQTGPIREYQLQFELLLSRVGKLSN